MAENSKIEWTDHTFNPWWGCMKVGPGCDHCYAETLDKRTGGEHWGAGAPRRRTSEKNWNLMRRLNEKAQKSGIYPKVFCASMADVFDNEVPEQWRIDLFELIRECQHLNWMLLTKRIGNVTKMLPDVFDRGDYSHVGIMATVVNQEEADRDIPKLMRLKKEQNLSWIGLSCEPLLGPIHLGYLGWPGGETRPRDGYNALIGIRYENGDIAERLPKIDWVICGGESGAHARPMHPRWAAGLRDQCDAAQVPFFFKQWGEWSPYGNAHLPGAKGRSVAEQMRNLRALDKDTTMTRCGKKIAGRELDSKIYSEFPRQLRAA